MVIMVIMVRRTACCLKAGEAAAGDGDSWPPAVAGDPGHVAPRSAAVSVRAASQGDGRHAAATAEGAFALELNMMCTGTARRRMVPFNVGCG